MRSGVTNSYNAMVWKTQKFATQFSINEGKYVGSVTGSIGFPSVSETCILGSNLLEN